MELGETPADPCRQMMQKQAGAGEPLDTVLSSAPGDVHTLFSV